MEKQIEVHAYHGWGFDAAFWNALKNHIPQSVIFKMADRGYFGNAIEPRIESKDNRKILLLHSFGLHWCPREKLEAADYIVLINSFNRFLSEDKTTRLREGKALNRMIKQFETVPEIVLEAFYKNCFYPEESTLKAPEVNIDYELLLNDLTDLTVVNIEFGMLPQSKTVICISGNDRIIPASQQALLVEQFPSAFVRNFPDAGHALPVIKSGEVWSFIKQAIPIL